MPNNVRGAVGIAVVGCSWLDGRGVVVVVVDDGRGCKLLCSETILLDVILFV